MSINVMRQTLTGRVVRPKGRPIPNPADFSSEMFAIEFARSLFSVDCLNLMRIRMPGAMMERL